MLCKKMYINEILLFFKLLDTCSKNMLSIVSVLCTKFAYWSSIVCGLSFRLAIWFCLHVLVFPLSSSLTNY